MADANERLVRENSIVLVVIDYGGGDKETLHAKIVTRPMQFDDEITLDSPVGQAIYRKKEGETVQCRLPSGITIQITIQKIEV